MVDNIVNTPALYFLDPTRISQALTFSLYTTRINRLLKTGLANTKGIIFAGIASLYKNLQINAGTLPGFKRSKEIFLTLGLGIKEQMSIGEARFATNVSTQANIAHRFNVNYQLSTIFLGASAPRLKLAEAPY